MTELLRVFVGWDARETAAYHVLCHSIIRRCSVPVSITPVARHLLPGFKRPRGPLESTEFSISRFLVPWLSGYEGLSIFMDCDMLCLADLADLREYCSMVRAPAWACKHDYTPKGGSKFLGHQQHPYAKKNWSSLVVFDNALCRALTPEYVASADGLDLHQFKWLEGAWVADLPLAWNWLVGEYPENPDAKVLHYTLGGPWFPETADCPQAGAWLDERSHMLGGAP